LRTKHLIYPAPEPGLGGLGTHLTFDLQGNIRFGPDVEWVDSPDDLSVNPTRLPTAIKEIAKYLPSIEQNAEKLQPDYAGIRPKLSRGASVAASGQPGQGLHKKGVPQTGDGAKGGFQDFIIRKEEGFTGVFNLLGIESPGLTSSLAIGEKIKRMVYGEE
jgi:L-2-hydroxyglutarate oxidase LhgO